MATSSAATALPVMHGQGSAHGGFHPHILPMWIYLGVFAALLVLTVITVAVAQVNLGPLNLVVAMIVATIKAALVALFFMHLLYDNKFYGMLLITALLFLAVFITITMFDTLRRGDIYPAFGKPIKDQVDWQVYKDRAAGVVSPQGHEGAGEAAHEPAGAAAHGEAAPAPAPSH
jgi:cytochrome c oxidase subunit IV